MIGVFHLWSGDVCTFEYHHADDVWRLSGPRPCRVELPRAAATARWGAEAAPAVGPRR